MGGLAVAVELMPPDTLVESTVRAVAAIAVGKAPAVGMISSRVAILIEEVLRTMVVSKLKLASVFVLVIGTAGAAGVLAQQGRRQARARRGSQSRQAIRTLARSHCAGTGVHHAVTRDDPHAAGRGSRRGAGAAGTHDSKFPSPDNPAVVRARETLEALAQRLDRIDRVLVDVVETYPTMVDFSRGPSYDKIIDQVGLGPVPQDNENAARRLGDRSLNEAGPARKTDPDASVKPMRERREPSPAQPVDVPDGRRGSQKTDQPDDSRKQGQSGEPQYRDIPDDFSKQNQSGKPQYRDRPDGASEQSQSGKPQHRDKSDDSSKQNQSGEFADILDGAGKKGQGGEPQDRDQPDGARKQSQGGEPQDRDQPDGADKRGQTPNHKTVTSRTALASRVRAANEKTVVSRTALASRVRAAKNQTVVSRTALASRVRAANEKTVVSRTALTSRVRAAKDKTVVRRTALASRIRAAKTWNESTPSRCRATRFRGCVGGSG